MVKSSCHRRRQQADHPTAFSLIELLVAVSIMAILVGWLLPTLHGARRSAHSMTCGSNVRQMVTAALSYINDSDGWIFPMKEMRRGGGTRWWFGLELPGGPMEEGQRLLDRSHGCLWPYYMATDTIEICPSFALNSPRYKPKFSTNWTTYGHPLKLMNPSEPTRAQRMARPAETAAFTDSAQINHFQKPATPARPLFEQWYYISRLESTVHYVHASTANASMYDGHVRTLEPMFGLIDLFPEAPVGRPPSDIRLQEE